jgi:hypothetical protein
MVLRKHLGSDLDKARVSLDRPEVMEEVLPPETERVLSSPLLEQVIVPWANSLPPLFLPPLCSTVLGAVWLLELLVDMLASTPIHLSSLTTSPSVSKE